MKCLILAAGYATRLYPLTENFPKPLLEVAGKTITDWLVDDIASCPEVDAFAVVTNSRFAPHFRSWASVRLMDALEKLDSGESGAAALASGIAVIDDGTLTNETRLGAVRDIALALETLGWDDDILVAAGDNVLDFSLVRFIEYAAAKDTTCIMRYREEDPARLRKSGIVEVGEDDLVTGMEEKPSVPKSNWCCPPFYVYSRSDAAKVAASLSDGCGADAPGSFIAWLCSRSPVHAMPMPGRRYDIGNLESYREVCDSYKGIIK